MANPALMWWLYYRLVSSHHAQPVSISSGSSRSAVIMASSVDTATFHSIESTQRDSLKHTSKTYLSALKFEQEGTFFHVSKIKEE